MIKDSTKANPQNPCTEMIGGRGGALYISEPMCTVAVARYSTCVTDNVKVTYAATESEVIHAKGAPYLYASIPDTIEIWKDGQKNLSKNVQEAIVQVDVLAGYEQGIGVFHYGQLSRIQIGDQCLINRDTSKFD